MSGIYKALGGETFSQVARITTGDDTNGAKIQGANPGAREPIPEGVVLLIPDVPSIDTGGASQELEIKVNGVTVGPIDNFAISMSIDAIWRCGFSLPNEPETRAMFVPLLGQRVTVDAYGERLFTGIAESPRPDNQPDRKTLEIDCYATSGIIEKVSPPLSAFPLEYTRANLPAIASGLCAFHGLSVDYRAAPGALFKRVDIKPNQKILEFLSRLASERGPVISCSETGELVIWEGTSPGNPVSRLEKGFSPCESVSMIVDESRYYSSVTGTIPAKSKKRKPGISFSVPNPFAVGDVRPHTFEARDIDEGELPATVSFMAGRMFAGLVSANTELSSWLSDGGDIYRPNQTIRLKSPEDYINTSFEFLISDVTLTASAGQKTAALSLVPPGVYSGEIPTRLPWM